MSNFRSVGNYSGRKYDDRRQETSTPAIYVPPYLRELRCSDSDQLRDFVNVDSNQRNNVYESFVGTDPGFTRSGSKYYCDICMISCSGPQPFQDHINSVKHLKRVTNLRSTTKEKASSSCDRSGKRLRGKSSQASCSLCGVTFKDRIDHLLHLNSQGHIHRPKPEWYCHTCGCLCGTSQNYTEHIAGRKHQRMMLLNPPRSSVVDERRKVEDLRLRLVKREEGGEEGRTEGSVVPLVCPICNVECYGPESYTSHLTGKGHTKTIKCYMSMGREVPDCDAVMREYKNMVPRTGIDPNNCIETFYSGRVRRYCCLICEMNLVGSQPAFKEAHLSSQRHLSNLRRLEALEFTTKCLSQRTSDDPPATAPPPPPRPPQEPSAGFANPPPPPPPVPALAGLGALVNSPPHLLADERYMKEKLKQVAQSTEEKEIIKISVEAITMSLRKILKSRGNRVDAAGTVLRDDPSSILPGVHILLPSCLDLLLRGQRNVRMAAVLSEETPSPEVVKAVAEKLEDIVKMDYGKHYRFVVEWFTHVSPPRIEVTVKPRASTTEDLEAKLKIHLTSLYVPDIKAVSMMPNASNSQDSLLDDVKRSLWLQNALGHHPAKATLVNVGRLVRTLVFEKKPTEWGRLNDYVMMVMLERLSFIDIAVIEGEAPSVRMGILFLRFLESLSAGILIGSNSELSDLPDPIAASAGSSRLLDLMLPKDVVDSSVAAQETLRLVTFHRIYELLGLPKFVPPCLSSYLPPASTEMSRDFPPSTTTPGRVAIDNGTRLKEEDVTGEPKRSRRF